MWISQLYLGVFKATIHRRKTVNCFMLLEKYFFQKDASEELTVFLIIYFKRWLISNCNGIVILCNKIIQLLFSKLMCCVCQVTSFCTKCPLKRRAFLQKGMLGKRWSAVKSFWWHMGKIILYWKICLTTKNIISSL